MESAAGSSSFVIEDYRTKERSGNFSKEEVHRLQLLVDKYKNIVMCKKTDGSSAKQKEHAWSSIEKEFNAIGQTPRNMKQLKYKFENMKRSAKKEASQERQDMRRTGGGKPPSLPPASEDATDWLRSIMSGSIDGNEAIYDDDVVIPNSVPTPKLNKTIIIMKPDADEIPSAQKKPKLDIDINDLDENIHPIQKNAEIIIDQNEIEEKSASAFDSTTPHSSLKKPVAPALKRMMKKKQGNSDNIIKRTLQEKKLSILDGLHDLELEKIRQTISQQQELHEQVMKHNEERHTLEMLKLKLDINILQQKNDSK